MLVNTFYLIVISKSVLGNVHSEALSRKIISSSPSKTLMSVHTKGCNIPSSREYNYLSFEDHNKLDSEKCYDGNGKFAARVSCVDHSKRIEPESFAICFDGKWYPSVHTCVNRNCKPINDTHSTLHTCTTPEGVEVTCRLPAVPGTKVTVRCAHKYWFEKSFYNELDRFCEESGQWQTLEECIPHSCSFITIDNLEESSDDSSLEVANQFLWNAIIYYNYNNDIKGDRQSWYQLCLGIVITNRLVLTSSNCFSKAIYARGKGLLRIAVGKYFKNYEDYDQAQMYDVTDYKSDKSLGFSIVLVSKYIVFSDKVSFACLGSNSATNDDLVGGKVGHMLISENNGSQSLLPLQYMSVKQCQEIREKIPSDGHFFCASTTKNHTFVPNELGGGLTFLDDSYGILVGVLFDIIGRIPIFINIGHVRNQISIEKEVQSLHEMIGGKDEDWPTKWALG